MTTAVHAAALERILADSTSGSHDTRLIVATLAAIAVIIALISWFKLHPFLSLTIGSLIVGAVSGLGLTKAVASYGTGLGATVASVGTLIALGAIFGKLLADSGGADQIVDTIVGRSSDRVLPWAMALVGMIIGLPMFFEIGLVLLMPVILLVARRSGQPLMRIALPAIAGLSAMHGFVPPHPGPLAAVGALKADLGLTLGLGVIVAVPCVIVAGPIFSHFAARWVDVPVPELFGADPVRSAAAGASSTNGAQAHETAAVTGAVTGAATGAERTAAPTAAGRRPSFPATLGTVLLPVILMLAKSVADVADANGSGPVHSFLDFIGTPLVALLLAVIVAMFSLGVVSGLDKDRLGETVNQALPPIAGILLIVAAGGGFKQVLVDSGISKMIAGWVAGSSVSPLLLAWFVAVLIRLATGSATVATVTTAGILAPVASSLSNTHLSLLVLAIGAGSLFFSHVNDAGFWLTKEYFGLTVGQNLKTWSLLETILSVTGIILVLGLSVVV
ncbi:GntP family permease [Jatrophihabitans telluris]|uniref:GntP family permease n=1 Tax=Jatrophihabitans telluris TaxID=2038343 RepID=A0ABY4QZ59_9ACTN|nr:SLC13 family permease [Jatrophihabitans telluris]UQX88134.1 GntP family permease [Jatrophihabitans telluris]